MESWSNDEVESAIAAAAKDLGYSQLTTSQSIVLHEYLSGKDVFVSLPTGSGKSPSSATGCSLELLMLFEKHSQESESPLFLLLAR
jgi:Lhr-like helicase